MSDDMEVRIGVVVHDRGQNGEDVFAEFVRELMARRDIRVGGLYQETVRNPDGPNLMELVDAGTGERFCISQPLGSGSASCCLDPSGLADASARLRSVLEGGVDLLIASKFAGAEADGEGLAPEIFRAVADDVPVLLLVSRRYLDKWLEVSGGLGTLIPATLPAMRAWVDGLSLSVSDPLQEHAPS